MHWYPQFIYTLKAVLTAQKRPLLISGGIVVVLMLLSVAVYGASGYFIDKQKILLAKFFPEWAEQHYAGSARVIKRFRRFQYDKDSFFRAVRERYRGRTIQPFVYTLKRFLKSGKMDNYWRAAKKYGVTIETVMGANPYLHNLKSGPDEEIMLIDCDGGGVLHMVQEGETTASIANLYGVSRDYLREHNDIGVVDQVCPRDVLIIPKVRPRVFTEQLAEKVERRKLFRTPCSGSLGRYFGRCMHPILGRVTFHKGMDIGAPTGTPVYSAAAGTVIKTASHPAAGKYIVIQHKNGFRTRYLHLDRIHVRQGRQVKQRRIIGRVGNTGRSTSPHLHFEVRKQGEDNQRPEAYIPVDPLKYIW